MRSGWSDMIALCDEVGWVGKYADGAEERKSKRDAMLVYFTQSGDVKDDGMTPFPPCAALPWDRHRTCRVAPQIVDPGSTGDLRRLGRSET